MNNPNRLSQWSWTRSPACLCMSTWSNKMILKSERFSLGVLSVSLSVALVWRIHLSFVSWPPPPGASRKFPAFRMLSQSGWQILFRISWGIRTWRSPRLPEKVLVPFQIRWLDKFILTCLFYLRKLWVICGKMERSTPKHVLFSLEFRFETLPLFSFSFILFHFFFQPPFLLFIPQAPAAESMAKVRLPSLLVRVFWNVMQYYDPPSTPVGTGGFFLESSRSLLSPT